MDAPFTSFTDESALPSRPQTHIEKTYERRYKLDHGAPRHDYWICAHPNGVCVVGICATHVLFEKLQSGDTQDQQALQIQFSKVKGQDLSAVKANGKKMSKRDGIWAKQDTVVCCVTATPQNEQGPVSTFECLAGIEGKVLQVNANLQTDPTLLIRRPYDDGHLLIACLFPEQRKHLLETWLSAEAFCAVRSVQIDDVKGGMVPQRESENHCTANQGVDES
eukprot:jgi/Ulvmu1/9835/UM056_0076.1